MRGKRRSNNDGSEPFLRPDGRYEIKISLGNKPNGKPDRRSVYGDTKDQVIQRRTALMSKYGLGLIRPNDQITLSEWLNRWLELQIQLSPRSFELYAQSFRLYVPDVLGKMRLQAIKRADLKWLEVQLAKRQLSVSTRSHVFQLLRAAFNEAIDQELLSVNPGQGIRVRATMAEQVKRATPVKRALTDEEMDRFLHTTRNDPLYGLFYTMFSLGLRRGEGLGLRWSDIDFEQMNVRIENQVKIVGGKAVLGPLKTVTSMARLHMSVDLIEVLYERRMIQSKNRNNALEGWIENGLVFTTSFGTIIHPRNVNRTMKRMCELAGIRHCSSHACRHTNITAQLRNRVPVDVVSKLARHSRISTTTDFYRSVFDDETRQATFSVADQRKKVREQ